MLNTVVVHILVVYSLLLYAVCLEHTYGFFVVSRWFTQHSLLLCMHMYTYSFKCKYPLYLGKLSEVNKCYAINQCVWAYNEHEYHMLPAAIKKSYRAPLVHSFCEFSGGNNCDSLI